MKRVTEVQKIECAFEFVCPKKWEDLEPTREGVRYCDTCFSDVFLCSTQDEVDKARGLRQCIAIEQVTQLIFMGVPSSSSYDDAKMETLPESVIDDLIKEADELFASRKKSWP